MRQRSLRGLPWHARIVLLIATVLAACGGEGMGQDNATSRDAGGISFVDPDEESGVGTESMAFDDSGIAQPSTDAGVGKDGAAGTVDTSVMDSGIGGASSPERGPVGPEPAPSGSSVGPGPSGPSVGPEPAQPDAVLIDFIAEAPHAGWHNNDGPVTWPLGLSDSRGSCMFKDAILEDGSQQHILFTHPKWMGGGFMHAAYTVTVPPASEKPQLEVKFGFLDGAGYTTGVTFGVQVKLNDTWHHLIFTFKKYNGALRSANADLSWLAGQRLVFVISADAGDDPNVDWAAWTKARIIYSPS